MNFILYNKTKKEDFLHPASSYLKVPPNNDALTLGNIHAYCETPPETDLKKVGKKHSFLKRIYHTLF